MVFWRKKDEGFEWREYVRTTILLRRQERRQKIEDVRAAAIEGARRGGRRGLDAAAAGLEAARGGVKASVEQGGSVLATGLSGIWATVAGACVGAARAIGSGARSLVAAARPRLASLRDRLEPAASWLASRNLTLLFALISALAAISSVIRYSDHGAKWDVLAAAALAIVMAALAFGPRLIAGAGQPGPVASFLARAGRHIVLLPGFDRLRPIPAAALAIALLGLATSFGVWMAHTSAASLPSLGEIAIPQSPVVEGRATPVSGDTLRIGGRLVRLAGVEAPETAQVCRREDAKPWRCGTAARDALDRAVRGRTVSCTLSGKDANGIDTAKCTVGETDLAADLVLSGHIFAATGFFATYATEEFDARQQGVGLWAGEIERPADWRSRLWEDARKSAPDGCPIKGEVRSGTRVYSLPWMRDYEGAKINESRGERWFCSEEEAIAAGWKLRDRS